MKKQQRKLKSKLSKFINFDFDSVDLTDREKSDVVMDVLTEFREFLVDIEFDAEAVSTDFTTAFIILSCTPEAVIFRSHPTKFPKSI